MSTPLLAPFLYPFKHSELHAASKYAQQFLRSYGCTPPRSILQISSPHHQHRIVQDSGLEGNNDDDAFPTHLNPTPDNYNLTPFVDKCLLTVQAGSGGHGCVSFLREKYIADGPPNGGDGGSGGSIFIQAVKTCTSLHTIARKREFVAGRGGNGQGGSRGGKKGEDVLIQVPVGTLVEEIRRSDPVEDDEYLERQHKFSKGTDETVARKRNEKWLFFPAARPKDLLLDPSSLPPLPNVRRSAFAVLQPMEPIRLDLDEHMDRPILLAAGATGGYGNPHFLSRDFPRPKVATKGDAGMRLTFALELKLLADVGLVGLPNAGKSTLLRALSNSRARIGNWAFTTLQPNIGTVVLDDNRGRPTHMVRERSKSNSTTEWKPRFTIADIPGLIEDAHLDRGLGLDFLRHVERAAVLAFVIDLSAGDAVGALKALWREVGEYETSKDQQTSLDSQKTVEWNPFVEKDSSRPTLSRVSASVVLPPITSKPWFVVATKADLPDTQDNFLALQTYIQAVVDGKAEHPSGRENAWKQNACAVPISGIKGEGVDGVVDVVVGILDQA